MFPNSPQDGVFTTVTFSTLMAEFELNYTPVLSMSYYIPPSPEPVGLAASGSRRAP